MVNIGSCGLHILHGAFKSGFQVLEWDIKKILKAAYTLLHDTPARRADYITITKSEKFPFKFSETRWVEDEKVANRLYEIWDNLKKLFKYWNSLPKSKQPNHSKSYLTVKNAVEDLLMPAKLCFFSHVARFFKKYLKKYQTQKPMLPYMREDLIDLHKSILCVIVKPSVVDEVKSCSEIMKINVHEKKNLRREKNFSLGLEAEASLSKLIERDEIDSVKVKAFYSDAQKCIAKMVEKLNDKCPLGSIVVRESAVFDPQLIVSMKKQPLEIRLKRLLQHLVYLKTLPSHKFGEDVVVQYFKFKDNLENSTINLDDIDRLDTFYFHTMKVRSKYPSLAKVLELVLTLSHGQADVERGFSINNSVIEDNITEMSIVSKRLVRDHYNSNKSFDVT